MSQTDQQDLFDIKVTASSKFYIGRFVAIARIIIFIALVVSFIHIAATLIGYLKINPDTAYRNDKDLLIQHQLMPYYVIVYCIFFFPQTYFYWQITKNFKKGLSYNDEGTFNKAFKSLYRYSIFGVVSIILSFFNYGFELYWYIKNYLK